MARSGPAPRPFSSSRGNCAAIGWLGALLPGGWPELRERNHQLAVKARRALCQQLQVPAPCPEDMLGFMATLSLPEPFQQQPRSGRIDVEQERLYDRFGIEVPLLRFGKPERRYFRISAHIYNSLAEYEYLGQALSVIHA
jgi:isopenicillin-N epimerase